MAHMRIADGCDSLLQLTGYVLLFLRLFSSFFYDYTLLTFDVFPPHSLLARLCQVPNGLPDMSILVAPAGEGLF